MIVDSLLKSVVHAWRGLTFVFWHEQNFRLELLIGGTVILAAAILGVSRVEFVLITFLITAVLAGEVLNTALERFTDVIKPRLGIQVKIVKDILAGMVLLFSVGSAIAGVCIFLPYLFAIFSF